MIDAHSRNQQEKYCRWNENQHDPAVGSTGKINLQWHRAVGFDKLAMSQETAEQGQSQAAHQEHRSDQVSEHSNIRIGRTAHRIQQKEEQKRKQTAEHDC